MNHFHQLPGQLCTQLYQLNILYGVLALLRLVKPSSTVALLGVPTICPDPVKHLNRTVSRRTTLTLAATVRNCLFPVTSKILE